MRTLFLFVALIYTSAMSLSFAREKDPAFNVLILQEKGSLRGMHEDDARSMKKTFKSIGEVLERHVNISCYKTSKTSRHKIRKWCSRIGSKDIVVVFYSGQDAQGEFYKGSWPLTKIGNEKIPLDQLANEIYAKNARLSLVFADCYDTALKLHVGDKRPYGMPLNRVKPKKVRHEIKHIWLSAKGKLLICSSKHGAYARGIISGKMRIGAFTEALLSAITYGTRGIDEDPDSGVLVYDKMIKLSKIPNIINSHMQHNPFSLKYSQCPFYSSTVVEE